MTKYLIHSISIILFMITINHYYRYLNYIPFLILTIIWLIIAFIIIRLEDSKF